MKYFDIHEMIEKLRLTQQIQVALYGICDLHNHLHDILQHERSNIPFLCPFLCA